MIGHLLGRFALLPAEPGNGLRPKAAVNYQDNQPEGFVGSGTHHLRENVEDNYIYIYIEHVGMRSGHPMKPMSPSVWATRKIPQNRCPYASAPILPGS